MLALSQDPLARPFQHEVDATISSGLGLRHSVALSSECRAHGTLELFPRHVLELRPRSMGCVRHGALLGRGSRGPGAQRTLATTLDVVVQGP